MSNYAPSTDFININDILQLAYDQLSLFASRDNFWDIFKTAFGGQYNQTVAETLRYQWQNLNFSQLPQLEIVSRDSLGNANGAYASNTNTIYLADSFLADASSEVINAVILEEIGHFIDAQVNNIDTVGDEGELFSALIRGENLTEPQFAFLKTENDSAVIILDGQRITVEQSAYTGTNLDSVINGIDQLLTTLQNGIDTQVYANQLPILGDTFTNSTNNTIDFIVNFQDDILNKLQEKLNNAANKTPELIRQALAEALGPSGLNLLQDLNGDSVIDVQDIQVIESINEVQFNLKLHKPLEAFSTALDTDIGLPNLGLTIEGQGQVELGYELNLNFGVNKDNGFYFDTSSGNEIKIDLNASLPNLNGTGNLGLLQLQLTDQGTTFNSSFNVDLKDGDNRLWASELPSANLGNLVDATLTGNADVNLNFVTSFGGSEVLPSLTSDFNLDWNFNNANADPLQSQNFGTISRIGFDNVQLDLDSFFGDFTRPILEKVKTISQPIQPILDILNKPIDLKFVTITLWDILAQLKDQNGNPYIDQSDRDFIEALAELTTLINTIPNSNLKVDLGSFDLGTANVRSPSFNLSSINPSNITTAPPISQQLAGKPEGDFVSSLDTIPGKGLEFPILTNSNQAAFNLLLGKNVDLFTYDLPKFQFSANYESPFIRIYGPFGAKIKGNLDAGIDLAFGYDTQGLTDFAHNQNPNIEDLLNGFYVSDTANPDGTGEDVPELTLNVGLNAYAGANVGVAEAGVGGGIGANIDFDLKNQNNDGKIRYDQFKTLLDDPLSMFCTSGDITAGLSAYVTLGWGYLSYTKTFDSPRITLLNYNSGCEDSNSAPNFTLAQPENGKLRLNIGPNAIARQTINTEDGAEVFYIQHESGSAGNEVVQVSASLLNPSDGKTFVTTQQYNAGTQIVGNGGQEDDVIELKVNSSDVAVLTPVALSGGAGNDFLAGGNGNDLLNGDQGIDQLQGRIGDDTLAGGTENDFLSGGAGADVLNGGDGFDIANYSTAQAKVTINLGTNIHTGDAQGDTFESIEQITGSAHDDVLTGNALNNIFEGADGNDSLNGGGGNDILIPGWGDDVVNGGNGTDTLVIDYSALPTQAVTWIDSEPNSFNYFAYVGNAWGIGTPIKTNLDAFLYYDVSISDDGLTLAIIGDPDDDNSSTNSLGTWVKKIHSNDPAVNVAVGGGGNPSLSGNGNQIVWTTYSSYGGGSDIWIANSDGTQVRKLTNDAIYDGEVTISDDGSTIAWAKDIGEQNGWGNSGFEILVANSDGTNIRRITNNNWNDGGYSSMSLSADGSKVAWQGNGIWVANTDGTGMRELSGSPNAYNQQPSISADGSKVVWAGYQGAGYSETNIYEANTDGSGLSTVPNTKDTSAFTSDALSGDGKRIVFSKYIGNDANNNGIFGLYVASVDGTEPSILIDTSVGWDYGGSTGRGAAISSYVDKGVSYPAFTSSTGSGEIYTWGPSRVRYSNIEQFDFTGTRYGDDLRGGNLEDKLTGGGGADTLKGSLGNDIYHLNPANAGGSQIEDTGGTDTLELKLETTDSNGFLQVEDFTLSLSAPAVGIAGLRRAGTTLLVDLNKDGIATSKDDLSILNFFDAAGTGAGTGFIETIANLSGANILSQLQIGNDTLNGKSEEDFIDGWKGNDLLKGDSGEDLLRGQDGNDALMGQDGNDSLEGGIGADTLTPGLGADQVNGGDGTDILVLDYSTLPTRAVAWSQRYYNQTTNQNQEDFFIGNAYGVGTPLKVGENYQAFALSSDGTTYAYFENNNYGNTSNHLTVKKVDNPNSSVKIPLDNYSSASDIMLSGNGSKIAWGQEYYGGLFVANSDGKNSLEIASNFYSFSLSDDGSKIAWINSNGLFVANSNGTNIYQIAPASTFVDDVYLSANGSKVIWGEYRDGEEGIWWANTNTAFPQVNPLADQDSRLIHSNGNKAIFSSSDYEFLSVKAIGNSDVEKAAESYYYGHNNGGITDPYLAMDGNKVAFTKPLVPADSLSLTGLYVADPYQTGEAQLIDTVTNNTTDALEDFGEQTFLTSSVNIGVRYQSFNLANGTGEINTWGPSHVKYTGVERFNITGTSSGDDLRGGNLSDTLKGGSGNDTIAPGLGLDVVDGGVGSDILVANYSTLSKNITTVIGTTTSTIGDGSGNVITYSNFETFNLTTGSGTDNIIGGSGADTLNGGTGADTLKGGAGNDTYVVDNAGDLVTEVAAQGTDLVKSSITYTLPAQVENLTLTGTTAINGTGNTLANILIGNTANNILNGGTGADKLKGGAGNDTYIVDNTGDVVTELANQGTDLVKSSITYTLPAQVENLTLTGTTAINGTGNTLANILTGNTANNTLKGGAGNDTYVINNAGDLVIELAAQGTDLIQSSVTYTLPAQVENLTLTGTTAINGTGNTLANILIGNTANNILNGGTGADKLKGGVGNDTYIVDNTGDVVTELANQGTDLVKSSITYTLPAQVENLTLTGTTAIDGTGNNLANTINGNSASNILNGGTENDQLIGNGGVDQLSGGDGNDSLNGGAGNDTLTGGLGADQFIYNTNAVFAASGVGVDTISDFTIAQSDQILLDKTTFSAISSVAGTGFSVSTEFATVTTDALVATSAADIVYNSTTGGLFYNQNGAAAGFGTGGQFLMLTNKPALTASQFVIQA